MIKHIVLYMLCTIGAVAEWMKEHPKKTFFLITMPLCIITSLITSLILKSK